VVAVIRKEKRETVLTLSDFHAPFEDKKAVSVALKFTEYLKPKIIVVHEVMDFYALSRFDKDPARKLSLQRDLDRGKAILKAIRKSSPGSRIILLESNHSKRLKSYLSSRAEELSCLKCLQIEELLGLKPLRIDFLPSFVFRDVLFKHGSIIRPHSSYTAKAELDKEGMSGVSGHTHRLGMHFKTLRGGKYVWIESGCLCRTDKVEYISGTANWQNGVSVVQFRKGSRHYYPTVIPIIDGEIFWGRRTFRA
jgi:hypothetical protein